MEERFVQKSLAARTRGKADRQSQICAEHLLSVLATHQLKIHRKRCKTAKSWKKSGRLWRFAGCQLEELIELAQHDPA
ncbi:hypothetical protein PHSY_005728 [Pseudozyma hubeiensis SY62]|uniref:Uncharacterized protein n=1 Tax=Pseudozyma hubeiensis (strain SY62) TaxID=1305764 RepID=R9P9V5_PSEHS|nr:hypothetical protein PHSY_005728 [Pseudozyma hubeiensis SY62]GAC98139.1 hypothetical protein PHSY_005728 [Pseudozyma hubeiensis SY62]